MIRILDSKSIQYELVDISVGSEVRDEMRSKAGDPTAVPPQLFNEDKYCGVRENKHAPNETVLFQYALCRFPVLLSWISVFPQNYEMFSEAVEADAVEQLLKLA